MSQLPDDVVILSAARTPIGKFQGSLSGIPAPQLGAVALKAAVERAGIDPALLSEVIMGNVVPAGEGQAPARQAAIAAGVPVEVGALTINKVCGSGLKAVMLAAAAIRAGDGDFYAAGGMESMNLAPFLLTKARFGYRLGNAELVGAVVHDGFWCPFERQHMGLAAEWIAEHYAVSRQAQDEFACASHRKALAAIDAGHFKPEIAPVPLPQRKGSPVGSSARRYPTAFGNCVWLRRSGGGPSACRRIGVIIAVKALPGGMLSLVKSAVRQIYGCRTKNHGRGS